jgi:hypothetical protein
MSIDKARIVLRILKCYRKCSTGVTASTVFAFPEQI